MGSNINAETNLKAAATMLRARWPDVRFSSVYTSPAAERSDQPDFLNAVAFFITEETPSDVQIHLHDIEKTLKKNPPFRYGPRTIDLDLLLFGERIIDTPTLTIPHSKMHQRRFVLEPLRDVASGAMVLPLQTVTIDTLLRIMHDQVCVKTKHTL